MAEEMNVIDDAVLSDPEQSKEDEPGEVTEGEIKVRAEILKRIDDSLQREQNWRTTGQKIQQIYKGQLNGAGLSKKGVRFNTLNSNVGILLPSLYSNPPRPEINSRSATPTASEDKIAMALQKTSTVFLDEPVNHESFKAAVKELLLPGRGTVRVRWDPIVESEEVRGPDGNPMMVHEKILDQMDIEHVYWEDFTHELTSSWSTCGWVAFRHLFTESDFYAHFGNSASVQQMIKMNTTEEIFRWTDKGAARGREYTSNSYSSGTNTQNSNGEALQDVIMKAMVWEFWDKSTREVIWICQDMGGRVLKIDPDPLNLKNFFPCPKPLLAVTTTDTTLPVPEYTIYQDLAAEIDDITSRISAITQRIKVRGAYNAASENLANILKEDDGIMVAVNGLDLDFDIKKHLYFVPINDLITAVNTLYQARNEAKQAMYEVTGISDIVRGQTRASETLGAQRIKSQFATLRIEDRKRMVEEFCRDTIVIMSEIIAENFSAESIRYYTSVELQEQEMAMLRNDGLRSAIISVETDSTISIDEQEDQEAMAQMTQALAMVMQQVFPMVQQGVMPLPIGMEMIKMVTKPFKFSKELNKLIDQTMAAMQAAEAQQPSIPGMGGAPTEPGAPPQ